MGSALWSIRILGDSIKISSNLNDSSLDGWIVANLEKMINFTSFHAIPRSWILMLFCLNIEKPLNSSHIRTLCDLATRRPYISRQTFLNNINTKSRNYEAKELPIWWLAPSIGRQILMLFPQMFLFFVDSPVAGPLCYLHWLIHFILYT